jgi:hypothetical protein
VYKVKNIMKEYEDIKWIVTHNTCSDDFREMDLSEDLKRFIADLRRLKCRLLIVKMPPERF